MTWKTRAEELKRQQLNYNQIVDILSDEFPDEHFSYCKVRGYLRRAGVQEDKPQYDIKANLKHGLTIDDIKSKANVSDRVAQAMLDDLKDGGLCINECDGVYKTVTTPIVNPLTISRDWTGDKIIRYGVVSDPHIGSKFCQITLLHEAYDIMKREGITDVYNAGDLTEGERMRAGHEYECYVHGADQYVDELIRNYPQRDGITTSYILGNHDASFIKHVGLDIARQIKRPDMVSLGMGQAYVNLTPHCMMEIRHPGGGSAYALSYKPQKIIEAMSGGDKPNLLLLGHYHKAEYIFYRNVHCIQCGTLQAQSYFMRDNSLAAHVGFWIVELHVNDEGQINRCRPEWFPFYKTIKDDWQNWR